MFTGRYVLVSQNRFGENQLQRFDADKLEKARQNAQLASMSGTAKIIDSATGKTIHTYNRAA